MAEAGLKVRYTTTANLVNELAEAADEAPRAYPCPASHAPTASWAAAIAE
ncbi:hypothetical protein [Streptomyces sp. NPDC060049]